MLFLKIHYISIFKKEMGLGVRHFKCNESMFTLWDYQFYVGPRKCCGSIFLPASVIIRGLLLSCVCVCVLVSGSKRAGRAVKMKRLCFGPEKKLRWRLVKKDRMA